MIVSNSIIILLVSSFCIEAAEFPLTCNETTWSREQNVNSVISAQEKEEIVKLRCALACQIVVADGTPQEREGQCVDGCIFHAFNDSSSLTDCYHDCQMKPDSSFCEAGCNVSSHFTHTSSHDNDTTDTISIACQLSEGRDLSAGETVYIPENNTCQVVRCDEDSSVYNFSVRCDALSRGCSVRDEVTAQLAVCCGYCGDEPIDPIIPITYILTNETLLLTLPSASTAFRTAAQSILVRVRMEGSQTNTTFIAVLDTSVDTVLLSVTQPACTVLIMDYVAINIRGVSLFSPQSKWTVAPGPVEELSVSFSEDPSLPQHANLELQWESPSFAHLLTGFQVTMETTNMKDFCQNRSMYSTILHKLDTTSLSVSINNTDAKLLPLYDCIYRINVTTFPGLRSITKEISIEYTLADATSIAVTCDAKYRPMTVSYDITVSWKLDPLAAAAVSMYTVHLLGKNLQTFDPSAGSKEVEGRLNVTFTDLEIKTEEGGGYFANLEVNGDDRFFWRLPLLPRSKKFLRYTCDPVNTPPHPPSAITNILVSELTYFISRQHLVLSLVFSWSGPMFPNGELKSFELMLRQCSGEWISNNEWEAEPSARMFTITTIAVPLSVAMEPLCFLIRSRNQYRISDWMSSLPLNISIVTEPPPSNTTLELPVFATVLISLAGVLLLLVVCIPLTVLLIYLRKHRVVKLDPMVILMSPSHHKSNFKRYSTRSRGLRDSISSQHSHILLPIMSPSHTSNHILTSAGPLNTDHWEIPYEELKVFDSQLLGKGAFGEVLKGHISSQVVKPQSSGVKHLPKFSLTCTVAVKRLKAYASNSEKLSFLKEIDLMKRVSESENEFSRFVVNMVGCVTVREPFLLVLEYVKHGDLLKYLRAMKNKLRDTEGTQAPIPYLEPVGTYSKLNPKDTYEDLDLLEEKDLLNFSRQIAAGMEHLTSLAIIHRDLACRNILVGDSKTLKISDFGMSRHIPNEEAYVLTSDGQVIPLRWMALESIFRREFTTASDVWSYGIVLWEISTMGDLPYPVYTNKEAAEQLKRGYRMPRPNKCSPEIYEVMKHCWCENPEDRPSFSQLRRRFDHFLGVYKQDHRSYIEITDQPYEFDRLAPETGQVGRNSFLDSGDSPLNIEQLGVVGDGENRSRGLNRVSILSNSMELLESPPSNTNTNMLPNNDMPLDISTELPRYTRSPSDFPFSSDLSIEGDLLQQLDRRLSIISVNRLRTQQSVARKTSNTLEDSKLCSSSETKIDSACKELEVSKTVSETRIPLPSKEDTDQSQHACLKVEDEAVDSVGEGVEDQVFGRRESLLERKKRDYFKFTLIPTCGVQFDDECDSAQGSREILI